MSLRRDRKLRRIRKQQQQLQGQNTTPTRRPSKQQPQQPQQPQQQQQQHQQRHQHFSDSSDADEFVNGFTDDADLGINFDDQSFNLSGQAQTGPAVPPNTAARHRAPQPPSPQQQSQQREQRRSLSPKRKQQKQQQQQHRCSLEELVLQLTPTPAESQHRFEAFSDVRDLLHEKLGLFLYVFGSVRTGIALPTSDVDIVCRTVALGHGEFDNTSSNGGFPAGPTRTTFSDDDDDNVGDDDNGDDDDDNSLVEQSQENVQQRDTRALRRYGAPISGPTATAAGAPASPTHHHRAGRRGSLAFPTFGGGPHSPGGGYGGGGGGGGRRNNAPQQLIDSLRVLRQDRRFFDIQPILHAKVPIVKLRHRRTGVEVDLGFFDDGLSTSRYLSAEFDACLARHNEPARALVVLLKAFVAGLDVNDPAKRGVGSFVCSLLVLFYLNYRRQYSGGDATTTPNKKNKHNKKTQQQQQQAPPATLRDLFIGMFRFYVEQFDVRRYGVETASMTFFEKPRSDELVMTNPLDPSRRNCASAAQQFVPVVLPAMERFLGKIVLREQEQGANSLNELEAHGDLADWILYPQQFLLGDDDDDGDDGYGDDSSFDEFGDFNDFQANEEHLDRVYERLQQRRRQRQPSYQQQQQRRSRHQQQQQLPNPRRDVTLLGTTKERLMRRWPDSRRLQEEVSSSPKIDKEGFYSALSF